MHIAAKRQNPNASKGTCAISGREYPKGELVGIDHLRPTLLDRIRRDHPALAAGAFIGTPELARYRVAYVEDMLKAEHGKITELDRQVAASIAN